MSGPGFTPEQDQAIRAVGRSVLVSAAAGSGKTRVLAERCAALIADGSDGRPCEAAELLVVTFTDAAAAEMRDRIGRALRKRLETPGSANRQHLEAQVALLPAAPISTVHSFCRNLIRRWFPVAGIDPQADLLDEEEALLLQYETIDALFESLYGARDEKAIEFQRLVEEDFDGRDTGLVEMVLHAHAFARSMPGAITWLETGAHTMAGPDAVLPQEVHRVRLQRIADELSLQSAWLEKALREWPADAAACCAPLRELAAYRDALADWSDRVRTATTPEALDELCAAIVGYRMNARGGGPRARSPLDEQSLDRARAVYQRARAKLLAGRLQGQRARFTSAEYVDGMQRVLPKQRTLAWLVAEFGRRYDRAKRADNVLDFSDLEQLAFRILAEDGAPDRPSAVARRCQQQYRHVLVDEFQDTNPIQAAILRLVSRETAEGQAGNLFAVGDVKQCIYAFRLAEPRLFLDRADAFRAGGDGLLIPLSRNFRSRSGVIRAVNAVFERCMTREFAGVDYDAEAALRAGIEYPSPPDRPTFAGTPVELHLLDRPPARRAGEEEEKEEEEAVESVLDWHRVEREAHLIGMRIRDFLGQAPNSRRRVVCEPSADAAGGFVERPIRHRDIVVLMRSPAQKAQRVADVLQQMGIPVHADVRGGYFDTAELRDMLALLHLLDNAEQDIPLAAVLRSPLAGRRPFTPGELARIRVHARHVPFHAAAAQYARDGDDPDLRERLDTFHARLRSFRELVRRRSLADVLWQVYEQTGYLAYVGGLPHGPQRRANLIGLHDRARQFGSFRRQGLRRFLRFIEKLQEQGEDLGTPSAASETDDVVRIRSVHQSKGLEYPVVFVADLGAAFNRQDVGRSVVLHRRAGLGMKVADTERGLVYPSLAWQVAADAVWRDVVAEELRILYVAMTRAKEHLVLVGTAGAASIQAAVESPRGEPGPADPLTLMEANCRLDWVLAAVERMPADEVYVERPAAAGRPAAKAVFAVHHHDVDAMGQWDPPEAVVQVRREALAQIAGLAPLPPDEAAGEPDAEVDGVIARLDDHYGPLPMTTVPARCTVTELKRQFDPFTAAEDRADRDLTEGAWRSDGAGGRRGPAPAWSGDRSRAADRGTLTHRFLQCLDMAAAGDERSLREQLAALIQTGRLDAEAGELVDVAAAAWFLGTDLGRRCRAAGDRLRREVTFVTRIDPTRLDATARPHDARDVVLLRGMIDALLPGADGMELIDYKTDVVAAGQVAERAAGYKVQIDAYADAVRTIWRRPVTARWLVFLTPRQLVQV